MKKNHIYLEGLGPGGLGSVNYERTFVFKQYFHMGITGGIGFSRFNDFRGKFNPDMVFVTVLKLDFSLERFLPKGNGFELAVGNTLTSTVLANSLTSYYRVNVANAVFGCYYRYLFFADRLKLRVGYSPILEEYRHFHHWMALSIGYRF